MKKDKNTICKFFLKGRCKYSALECFNSHSTDDVNKIIKERYGGKKENTNEEDFYQESKFVAATLCKKFLEGKCQNSSCSMVHDFSALYKNENNSEFSIQYMTLVQDFNLLTPYEEKIAKTSGLDLMFLVDCTGSMSSWINTVKEQLYNIIDSVGVENPMSSIRISFVGYRDFCDKERFSIIDFTEDAAAVTKFIAGVQAIGGGDLPEDISGGLQKALKQSWKSPAKYCILIADSPPHNKKYYDSYTIGDDYPNGHIEDIPLEELITQFAKKGIEFFGIKITDHTNKMYKILSESYSKITKRPIETADLGQDTSKFGMFVSYGATATLKSVTNDNVRLGDVFDNLEKKYENLRFKDYTYKR